MSTELIGTNPRIVVIAEFFFPGFAMDRAVPKEVPDRDIQWIRPISDDLYAVRFYDIDLVNNPKGGVLRGEPYNYSPILYLGGEILTYEQVKEKMPNEKTLISNMEINKYKRVIRTRAGHIVMFGNSDIVIKI